MAAEPILVVDDHPADLKLVHHLLLAQGYDVRVAANLDDALVLLRDFRPRLILMDLQQLDRDGIALAHRLREHCAPRPVPIYVLTVLHANGDGETALAAGLDASIAKPIDVRSLSRSIAEGLAESR